MQHFIVQESKGVDVCRLQRVHFELYLTTLETRCPLESLVHPAAAQFLIKLKESKIFLCYFFLRCLCRLCFSLAGFKEVVILEF
jgi:hypothetical protein